MARPATVRTFAAVLGAVLVAAACTATASPGPSSGVASPGGLTSPPSGSAPPDASRPRVLIDTDMAADDIVAIASMLHDPSIDVVGITVAGTGEAHCPGGMFVARSLVTMLRETPVPVACGQASPLGDAQPFPSAWRAGADAGNGLKLVRPAFVPDDRSAPELIVALAAEQPAAAGPLRILTTGPLTNLASAAELDPSLPDRVVVTSMLGAVGVPGNVMPEGGGPASAAEWNAHADPTAVRRVLDAGFDLTLVALNATNSTPLTQDLFQNLESDHAAGPADVVFELWAKNPYMTAGGFYLWDPVAAMVIRKPEIITTRPVRLRVVEGDGPEGGRLVEDPNGANVTLATGADRGAFESALLAALRMGQPRQVAFSVTGTITVTAGPGTCNATLDPAAPPVGVVSVSARNNTSEGLSVVAFNFGAMHWQDLERYAANPPSFEDPATTPPPVTLIASVEVSIDGTATGYGDAPSGSIGVACITGPQNAPKVSLAGPFEVGP